MWHFLHNDLVQGVLIGVALVLLWEITKQHHERN